MKKISIFLFSVLLLWSCEPYEDADITLAPLPATPDFTYTVTADNPNKIVFTDVSTGYFARVWDFGTNADGATTLPPSSTAVTTDTIEFLKKGDYTVTLHVSAENGGGTAQVSKVINIAEDAVLSCDPQIALLTGDCLPSGKCWTFSTVAGAVTVGPTPGASDWFTSTQGGLQAEQYDDRFCFFFDNASFLYMNNGQTVDPWNGFVPVDYTPPTDHTWTLSKGTGNGGKDQIILTEDSFLGVWDASEVYDIVSLTETELVVQTEFLAGGGWFELYFVAQ